LLGLIGLALHVNVNTQLGGDAAAVGPYLVSHLGMPTWLVILYVIVVLSACYSVIDSAFTATSSVFVVDVIKPLVPKISEKQLFLWAKIPMFFTAIIAAGVVLTGVDFVTIVLTSYAIRTAILIPLVLALFWSRTTGWGFVGGTVLAIAIGMPIRAAAGDLWGSVSILAISAIVPIVIGLLNNFQFDFARLRQVEDATITSAPQGLATE
jgi:Na+/proline symporter